jgi:hypothetical protein
MQEHRDAAIVSPPRLVTRQHANQILETVTKHKNSHDINLNHLLYTRNQLIIAVRKLLQGGGYGINDAKQLMHTLGEDT